ncbi:MAG: class I SAM-dependent methyltransferase [Phycisphaerales bacterium]
MERTAAQRAGGRVRTPLLRRLGASLAHPLTRGLDLDDPRTTAARRRIIREKAFLRKVYEGWYRDLAGAVPPGPGEVLELGSGAGFLADFIPGLITSELFPCPGIQRVVDARELPFEGGSLRAIVMLDVLHHIPGPRRFLAEAARCIRPGGVVAMIEPWNTPWSRLVYTRLHHEPFLPAAPRWEFPASGPLSGANGALPWIIFHRDRALFEREFPQWRIGAVRLHTPLRYLLSGGVSMRALLPGVAHGPLRALEGLLAPLNPALAMFAQIVLVRTPAPAVGERPAGAGIIGAP